MLVLINFVVSLIIIAMGAYFSSKVAHPTTLPSSTTTLNKLIIAIFVRYCQSKGETDLYLFVVVVRSTMFLIPFSI
jgi:hypothetical protein